VADPQRIAFLYRQAIVPDPVMEAAKAGVPDGFSFALCESETPDSERRDLVATADYIMAYGVAFDDLDVAKSVRLFQLLSAGFDRLDLEAFADAGIPVANNGGANAPTVAEHAVLLMLAVFKKLPLHHNALNAGEWLGAREALNMRELRGKQVGIVGFGRIGQEVARIASGFLASVVYYDVQAAPKSVEREFNARKLPLQELLETSDVVTVHTPLNDATRGLIGSAELARMKPTAILINTSRGPVVKQDDVAQALKEGRIAGAGLDVFEREPLEPDSPLLGLENVVVTPHNAGTTIDTWWRRLDFAFANIERVSRGELPLSTVGG
jgi:phosphoglycerate dehydrogenase-like enzyme